MDELMQWVDRFNSRAAGQLSEDLKNLHDYSAEKILDIEVAFGCDIESGLADSLAAWIAPGLNGVELISESVVEPVAPSENQAIRIHVFPVDEAPIRRAVEPCPPILVLVADSQSVSSEEVSDAIEDMSMARPYVALVIPREHDVVPALKGLAQEQAWYVESIDLEAFPEQTLYKQLTTAPLASAMDLMHTHAVARALESAEQVFGMILKQEENALRLDRISLQQRANQLQQQSTADSASNLLSDIRSLYQRHFDGFERETAGRLEELLTPPDGTLRDKIETCLETLKELEKENRAKAIVTHIPEEFTDRLTKMVNEALSKHCANDLMKMQELFRNTNKEVDEFLKSADAPGIIPQFRYIDSERVKRLLESQVRIDANYQGQLPRTGIRAYLMGSRAYLMIAGMLGTLVVTMLGFSEKMIECFGTWISDLMRFLTPVLVVVGIVTTIRALNQERTEAIAEDLEKAREALHVGIDRICSDVQREWSTIIREHLREQLESVVSQIEIVLEKHYSLSSSKMEQQKKHVQLQLQGLDNRKRDLDETAKALDKVRKDLAQFRGELRQLFSKTLEQTAQGSRPSQETGVDSSPLFSIGLDFQTHLDSRRISDGLREAFESNGASLSPSCTVLPLEKGNKWMIMDRESQQRYTVKKEEEKLNVYASAIGPRQRR